MSSATLLASSSMLALASLALDGVAPPLTGPALAWLGLQAAVLTVGYVLYFALQRRADPVTFSFIGYVMMLVGVAIGTLAFGERLPWTLWPATALVLAALVLLQPQKLRGPVLTHPPRAAAP
jgi:drug/metabolite transporter (DMT)-like permease